MLYEVITEEPRKGAGNMQTQVVFDESDVLQRLAGNENLVRLMIRTFMESVPRQIDSYNFV